MANDHVLKKWAPGFATGKMSDFVGPFVLYGLLVLRGYGLSSVSAGHLTLVFSVCLKLNQEFSNWVAASTCGNFFSNCKIIADPTDLLAFLPFVFVWRNELRNQTELERYFAKNQGVYFAKG